MKSETAERRLRTHLALVLVSLAWAWIGLMPNAAHSAAATGDTRSVIEHVHDASNVPAATIYDTHSPLLGTAEDDETAGCMRRWQRPVPDVDPVPAAALVTGNPNRAPPFTG